ncbi:MAG: hypothetical protein RMK18_12165 [Armatimonadota bacterium]|nr:hypothetical protein [Armatimonadota bacterium]
MRYWLKFLLLACFVIFMASAVLRLVWGKDKLSKDKLGKDNLTVENGVIIKKFNWRLSPFDILIEAEPPNGQRGIYAVRLIEPSNQDNDDEKPVKAKVDLIIPHGSRPRWSPKRHYVLFEWKGRIGVVDRNGVCVLQYGTMGGFPVYGWGPDDNTILIGAGRFTERAGREGLGFMTIWKKPWEIWTDRGLYEPGGIPAVYGITFPHAKLPDDLWLGSPAMSPDHRMHAFEAFRPVPKLNYGRTYSKIYLVKWVEPPGETIKNHDWLPISRLTNLPDELWEINPKWSPDGKWIAFEVIDNKAYKRRVYIASPEKGIVRPIPTLCQQRDKRFKHIYEDYQYSVLGWLSEKELLISTEFLEPVRETVTLWLFNLDKETLHCVFFGEPISFAVSYLMRSIATISDDGFGPVLKLTKIEENEGEAFEIEVEGFPKDMTVYWMDW